MTVILKTGRIRGESRKLNQRLRDVLSATNAPNKSTTGGLSIGQKLRETAYEFRATESRRVLKQLFQHSMLITWSSDLMQAFSHFVSGAFSEMVRSGLPKDQIRDFALETASRMLNAKRSFNAYPLSRWKLRALTSMFDEVVRTHAIGRDMKETVLIDLVRLKPRAMDREDRESLTYKFLVALKNVRGLKNMDASLVELMAELRKAIDDRKTSILERTLKRV